MIGFDADAVVARLTGERLRGPVMHLQETTSTNDVAARLAGEGHPEGTVVVADCQTAGRGRRGHVWSSPPRTGLLFTALLRPHLPPAECGLLAGACGVAVALGLGRVTGTHFATKWPNDVVHRGRKVAGILVEGQLPDYAAVGIGVNLLGDPEAIGLPTGDRVTTVQEATGVALGREEALGALLDELDRWYGLLLRGERSFIVDAQERLDVTVGREVTLTMGDTEVRTTVVGLSETGRLRVLLDGAAIEISDADGHTLRLAPPEVTD